MRTDLLLVEIARVTSAILLESQVLFTDTETITFSSQLHKMKSLP